MKILYVSKTPLTGVAAIWTRVVNNYTEHEARCLNGSLGVFRWYARDPKVCPLYNLMNEAHRDECLEWADVVHSFNYASPRKLDRADLLGQKPWVHMICGDASAKIRHAWHDVDLSKAKFVVVAEGWHRNVEAFKKFEPYAVLPNLFDIHDSVHFPYPPADRWRRASYAPSTRSVAPTKTNTKGYRYVLRELVDLPLDVIEDESFEGCMGRKAVSWIAVDEVSTPMMHHGGPEYVALGVPCISRYDDFTERLWKEVFQFEGRMPFINGSIENLRELVEQGLKRTSEELRVYSEYLRGWARKHMDPAQLIERYLNLYETL